MLPEDAQKSGKAIPPEWCGRKEADGMKTRWEVQLET